MTRIKVLQNILAVVAGLAVGGGVNMALVNASPLVIPPPAGVDVSDPQSLSESMHLLEPKHFVFPFLAHAVGTLVGPWSRTSSLPAIGRCSRTSSGCAFWPAGSRPLA